MAVPHTIRTWLTERLGLRYPIIQAPMAGGPTTPQLVAAVGNAGALGSFGFAYSDPAAMRQQMEAARATRCVRCTRRWAWIRRNASRRRMRPI